MVACLASEPNGWLLVGVASGMFIVKVHEWCLVCYVWLAAALATTSMLSYLFSYAARLVSPCPFCGFTVLNTYSMVSVG